MSDGCGYVFLELSCNFHTPPVQVSQPALAALVAQKLHSSDVPGTVSETGERTTHSGASQTPLHRLFHGFGCIQFLLLPCTWKCMLLGGFQSPCSPSETFQAFGIPTPQTHCTHPAFVKICCVYQNYFGPSSTGVLKLDSLGVLPQLFAVIKSS